MVVFKSLAIGAYFECNGNIWQKRSSRTACMVASRATDGVEFRIILAPHPSIPKHSFYFGSRDHVHRNPAWWERMGFDFVAGSCNPPGGAS